MVDLKDTLHDDTMFLWAHLECFFWVFLYVCAEDIVKTCSPSQFACTNGNCVSQSMVCDGNNDCGDNSDEVPELQCGMIQRL